MPQRAARVRTPGPTRGRSSLVRRSGLALALAIAAAAATPRAAAEDLRGFHRGDCNADGPRNVSDPIFLLELLFGAGSASPCQDACDANDDGDLDLSDAVLMLGLVFTGTPAALPAPLACGFDPTGDTLDCPLGTCAIGPVIGHRSFTLETAREGLPYRGDLPREQRPLVDWQEGFNSGVIQEAIAFVEHGLPLDGALPGDLVLDPATGAITGTAVPPGLHSFAVWARNAAGEHTILHVDIAAFDAAESAIIPGQDLSDFGTQLVAILDTSFVHEHPLPWPTPYPLYACSPVQPPTASVDELKLVRIYYPLTSTGPTPLLVFHHGTGYGHTEYQNLLLHLASHGIAAASVNDQYPYEVYPDYYCWGGHDESARVLVATRQFVEALAEIPGHPLEGRLDADRVFYGGHSRGGAAALIAREIDPDVRGVIALEGTDARRDTWIGNTNRWIELPDVPVLAVTAEQDTDVIYPYSERLLERFTGAATMVTIYGGCHAYTTDAATTGCAQCVWDPAPPAVDNCRYITRDLQQLWTERYVTAFLRRYGYGDLSVEGLLYGEEHEGSPYVGVTARRNLSGAISVADFASLPLADLGGLITSNGMQLFLEGPCYDWPFPLPAPIDPISNLVLIAPPTGVATFDVPLTSNGSPLDVTGRKNLTFRIKNHDIHGTADNVGLGHFTLDVRLQDDDNDTVLLSAEPHLPSTIAHPQPEPPTLTVPLKYQRFITVTIPLANFTQAAPFLDLTSLTGLRFVITTNGTATVDTRLGFDDIRFE